MRFFGRKKHGAPASVPEHIAIILDGNGRWARKRGMPRTAGMREERRPSAVSRPTAATSG